MYNIGFLLSFVAPVQLLFPLLNSNLIKIKHFSNISTGTDSLASLPIDTSSYNIVNVVSTSCYVGSIMVGIGAVNVRCESWSGESIPNANGLDFWIIII